MKVPMSTFVRAASLTNFEQVAREYGLHAAALIEEVGLPAKCLTDPDLRLPAELVGELLELAARSANEPSFALRMASTRRLSNLGPLGLLLRDQPTLRLALETMVSYLHTHAEALSLHLVESGEDIIIQEELALSVKNLSIQAIEMSMCSLFRMLQIFLGERWQPKMVTFIHSAPGNTKFHKSVFGNHIAFGQEFNSIVCNSRDLEAPNLGADPVMARYSRSLLEREIGANAKMSERLKRLIILLLPRGHCRIEVVAQHLGMDRRSIYNHLTAEGLTFKKLVNSMREDLLSSYLQAGSKSLSEVAVLLGFSELSAFSRWHRNQFGQSARDRR